MKATTIIIWLALLSGCASTRPPISSDTMTVIQILRTVTP